MSSNEICAFDLVGRKATCLALRKKECDGCAFYKTKEQAKADEEHAAEILRNKGLEAYQRGTIMTTRPITQKRSFQFIINKREGLDE